MLIALLVVLGVNLVVIVAVAALVLGRRRWLERQPGQFVGAIRVAGEGALEIAVRPEHRALVTGALHGAPSYRRNEITPARVTTPDRMFGIVRSWTFGPRDAADGGTR